MHRLLHLADHETEAGDIEKMRPGNFPAADLVADDETGESQPDKEVENVAKFAGEEGDRFEKDRDGGNKNHRRRSEE